LRNLISSPAIHSPDLCLSRSRSRREALSQHDFGHAHPIRWAASRRVHNLRGIAEELRSNRRRHHQAERRRALRGVVFEPVNRASGNAEWLSISDVDCERQSNSVGLLQELRSTKKHSNDNAVTNFLTS
jgi:hypothetical protein